LDKKRKSLILSISKVTEIINSRKLYGKFSQDFAINLHVDPQPPLYQIGNIIKQEDVRSKDQIRHYNVIVIKSKYKLIIYVKGTFLFKEILYCSKLEKVRVPFLE
jgi:hypothetical protein